MDLIQDEILKSQTVDLNTCDLREVGKAIFDHMLALNEASQSAKFADVAAPAKPKPATKPQTEAAYAAAPAEDDDWEQRLLDLTTVERCDQVGGQATPR